MSDLSNAPQASPKIKKALLIAVDGFTGFSFKSSRLCLGWAVLSMVPADVKSRLELALTENQELRAQLASLTAECENKVSSAVEESDSLRTQLARVTNDGEQKLSDALREKQVLETRQVELAEEHRRNIEQAANEIESLHARLANTMSDGAKLQKLIEENGQLHERIIRITDESEQKVQRIFYENEKLKSLMERVSCGVR